MKRRRYLHFSLSIDEISDTRLIFRKEIFLVWVKYVAYEFSEIVKRGEWNQNLKDTQVQKGFQFNSSIF